MRMNRMERISRGRTAVVGQMIRNRLENEKLKTFGVPPAPTNLASMGNVSTACIRGAQLRCRKKPTKNKDRKKMYKSIQLDILGDKK